MIHLGYGKYWKSDEIVGLKPIEENRGPGRRTEVFIQGREDSIVASRSEAAILRDMTRNEGDEGFRTGEAVSVLHDLLDDLGDLKPDMRKALHADAGFDVEVWIFRLRSLLDGSESTPGQEDLFSPSD